MLYLVEIHQDGADTAKLLSSLPAAVAWLSAALHVEEIFDDHSPIGTNGFWGDVQEICEDQGIIVAFRAIDPEGLSIAPAKAELSCHDQIAAARLRQGFVAELET